MYGLYLAIIRLVDLYQLLIVVWAVMSWIPYTEGWARSVRETLGIVVEPFVGLFRRFIPPLGGMDFSPVVAIMVLRYIPRLFATILF